VGAREDGDQVSQNRVRVAAANDYELIVSGVAALLRLYSDRLDVRDRIVMGDPIENGPIDVVLYDTYGRTGIFGEALTTLLGHPDVHHVAVFSLDLRPEIIEDARAAGATGFISKALTGDEIADAIERIAAGEEVVALSPDGSRDGATALELLDWPGKDEGLTERESQVLVLLAEGLTNPEIATSLYLGVETVKTHVATIIRKLDLRNRVQAATYVARSGTFSRYQPADPPG
jgi:NarL family two-component system response regulator LiaR